MKLSEQWLREWVNPPIHLQALISQLTMAGHEVEAYGPVAGEFSNVIVTQIISVVPHPNAERLQLCQVDTGQETVQVVCGGKNVRAGLKVPLAKVGAQLPNNMIIKKAKIRGLESQGMICSSSELGLYESAESIPGFIMELPDDAPIGCNFREYLHLNDCFIELSLTPNRGDCLSVQGIARELAAINTLPLLKTVNAKDKSISASITDSLPIELKAPEGCPYYIGRVIKHINPRAKTPLWLKERLRRSDVRSISPVVDITNYVMLELGQPLHAFDLEKLTDGIVVRFARDKEKLLLLNNTEVELTKDTLIIADEKNPLAIAGIIGGMASSVGETTRHVFLESAFFTPKVMIGKGIKYSIHTDSLYRFERGVDPTLQKSALQRVTELLLEITGGESGPFCEKIIPEALPPQKTIYLRAGRILKYLGIQLDKKTIENLLARLNFRSENYQEGWKVYVPPFRFDVNEEVDLLEEIARLYGYDKIPLQSPSAVASLEITQENRITTESLANRLQHLGYHQAMTYSFVDPKLQRLLYPHHQFLMLSNPIASDMAAMRISLLPGLINAVIYNQHRQQTRLRFFEIGQRFVPDKNNIQQDQIIAGIAMGAVYPKQWGISPRAVDFFDVKGDVENLLALSGHNHYNFVSVQHPSLHPGQSAMIQSNNGQTIGYLGVLAPAICQVLNINHPIVFELELERFKEKVLPHYKALSKFPAVRRDLAIVIDEKISVAQIQAAIRETAGFLLQDMEIFDIYTGKNVQNGKKSVAIGLILQHSTRTLIDEEVNQLIDKIILKLKKTYQASLR